MIDENAVYTCNRCIRVLPANMFGHASFYSGGRHGTCRQCHSYINSICKRKTPYEDPHIWPIREHNGWQVPKRANLTSRFELQGQFLREKIRATIRVDATGKIHRIEVWKPDDEFFHAYEIYAIPIADLCKLIVKILDQHSIRLDRLYP